ncbi:protein phosphatase regulator [Coemansia javaensis]|uniref:Protein phosphatase regulator n=1 Tax=Coemansia javaensis TaxID=2761396 RepID=A0A9W8H7Q2_9FUNG|nr:protein phosphatase regulator [Coemansia javaensis]
MNFQGLEFDGVPADGEIVSDDNDSDSSLVDEDVEDGFVYALFHFPQMVDGQITVEEGEKLTLLDDSNSYWWLVQSLRDNKMGYIPADNIETSEGKKARVYRRRNLRLCQPDAELIRLAELQKPRSNGRRVNFSENLVTKVVISSPVTDDEDYEGDEDYDYDYDNENPATAAASAAATTTTTAQVPDDDDGDDDDDNNDRAAEPRAASADQPAASLKRINVDDEDDEGNDSDGYSYYYSAAAGESESYANHSESAGSDAAGLGHGHSGARRVSIAPLSMGQIDGEVPDNDDDDDDDDGDNGDNDSDVEAGGASSRRRSISSALYVERRESTILVGAGEAAPSYYPSNDESDDGDSLTGVLGRLNGSRASHEAGRHTFTILHADAFSADGADVSVFEDELLGEVLRRALAVFGLSPRIESTLALYAYLGDHDLVELAVDAQATSLLGRVRARASDARGLSGAVSPSLCRLVLADRAVPQAQLLARVASAAEDPYATMDTGSRSILRTSVAASISEGITSLASQPARAPSRSGSESGDDNGYSGHAGSAADDSNLVPAERRRSPQLAALRSSSPPEQQRAQDRRLPSAGNSDSDSNSDNNAELPDSRQVVQGLLRNIPRPATQPPQSAIDRAKRNTLQLPARASTGDVLARPASAHAQTRPDAGDRTRAASVATPTTTGHTSAAAPAGPASAAAPAGPAGPTPTTPAAIHGPLQALGLSASTLRPSSDTFIHEGSTSDTAEDNQENTAVEVAGYAEEPASPTESSGTASTQHDGSEDATDSAVGTGTGAGGGTGALAALSHSSTAHRLLKDSTSSSPASSNSSGNANANANVQAMPAELPLDDWLVILHGWSDMHDINANAASFYQAFLKDAQPDAGSFIREQMAGLSSASSETQAAIDDILGVSQGVGRRLDALERELDEVARILIQAN